MSPSTDGCTITIALKGPVSKMKSEVMEVSELSERIHDSQSKDAKKEDLIVAAVRILVGSSHSECLPSCVYIQGRPVNLKMDAKRWYDLPLTWDEVLKAVRNGFISLGIGPVNEKDSFPVLDAVEVYAISRSKVQHLIPQALGNFISSRSKVNESVPRSVASSNTLNQIAHILSYVYGLVGVCLTKNSSACASFEPLIRNSLQSGDKGAQESMMKLLEQVESDSHERQKFLDDVTISVVFEEVQLILHKIGNFKLCKFEGEIEGLNPGLSSVSSIVIFRPENYMKALQRQLESHKSIRSIGCVACDIILLSIEVGIPCCDILENVIQLILSELTIGEQSATTFRLATFDSILMILKSENQYVIEVCCEAIKKFMNKHSSVPMKKDFFHATDIENSAPIAYQCDSCSKFPITEERYTLLEDENDIDLCSKCYKIGWEYAEKIDFCMSTAVIINERSIGGDTKLSCGNIQQMQSVPIMNGTAIVEQVAKFSGIRNKDPKLQLLRASQLETKISRGNGKFNIEAFTDDLFENILSLVENILDGTGSETPAVRLNPILSLLLDSVNLGSSDRSRISRAKRYVQAVFKFVKRMLDSISVMSNLEKSRQILLVNFLNSLCWLTGIRPEGNPSTGDDVSDASPTTVEKCKRKTDPRYSCDIHGVPAVRRRCSSGANKDRRFYVCGMDRKQRCNYFKWADQSIRMENPARNIVEKEIDSFIWKLLIDTSSPHPSLSDQICDLVGAEIFKRDGRHNIESQFSEMKSSSALALHRKKNIFSSFYSRTDEIVDFRDGVYRSREKFNRYCGNPKSESDESVESQEIFLSHSDSDEHFLSDKYLEASMNLISAVASPSSSKDFKVPGQQRWYSLLSKVICLNTASRLRPQATLALKRMCLGDRALYHSVRDHYVFGFQVKEIFQNSKGILRGALCVREQARQCGDNWKDECTDSSNLDAGALLGTIDLIQEDCITLHVASRIGIVLDDLLRDARSRVLNWRNFCSKVSFEFDADIELGKCRVDSKGNNDWMDTLFCGPPIFTLFWLSCSFSGPNQIKVMALIDLALTSKEESKYLLTLSSIESVDPIGSSDILGGDSLEGGVSDSTDIDKDDEQLSFHSGPLQRPEEILLNDSKAISLHDIFSFASQFVLKGRTVELRKVSSRVVIGLCRNLDSEKRMNFIEFLVEKVVSEIENLGCASTQSMQLLQTLFKIGDGMKGQDLDAIGRKIAEGFTKQMRILHWIRENESSCLEPERILPSKFDTTKCVHCHRLHNFFSGKGGQKKVSSQLQAKKNSRDLQNEIEKSGNLISKCQIPWAYEQVRPFIKLRLESSIENTCSSAFSFYAQLKCRLSISEVHLTISDPRARFVKTIVIYATPRQVSKVNDLKSPDYDHVWQKCAVITLARGAKRGACSLPVAVTAANIKIEYCEFYDRSQGNKNDDGSFVLFCPRCSRQVNNAHGVCGSCGECVFQCRRCRQIHYDSPDAFLCAECGHCSSGTFSFHLTAGVASNSVAIVDDESCIRTIKILSQAKKLYEDLLSALTERVRECFRKRELSGIDQLTEYGPAMKRALMGDMPKIDYIGKSSKIQKMNNNSDNNGDANAPSSAANRARSLLRLARQLRGEGDQANRNRESLVREAFLAGSDFQLDEVDDDGVDMFSLWGSGDRSNALNRLIATFANPRTDLRLKERAKLNSQTAMGNNLQTKMAIKDDSNKGVIQECEKLYQLTREAERECYELQRRLDAWRNLEMDCLKEIAMKSPNNVIRATKCIRCAGNVTLHLLLLLLRLVQSNSIKDFQKILGKEFVQALLMEPSQLSKDLFNLKRLAVTTLCMKSEHASLLILDELRVRLKASNDRAAASMLGKLLEIEFPLSDQFFALATETLNATVT
jgi:GRF zinc finger